MKHSSMSIATLQSVFSDVDFWHLSLFIWWFYLFLFTSLPPSLPPTLFRQYINFTVFFFNVFTLLFLLSSCRVMRNKSWKIWWIFVKHKNGRKWRKGREKKCFHSVRLVPHSTLVLCCVAVLIVIYCLCLTVENVFSCDAYHIEVWAL